MKYLQVYEALFFFSYNPWGAREFIARSDGAAIEKADDWWKRNSNELLQSSGWCLFPARFSLHQATKVGRKYQFRKIDPSTTIRRGVNEMGGEN